MPPGSYAQAAVILLSDGQRTTGPDPIEAAKRAANRGVRTKKLKELLLQRLRPSLPLPALFVAVLLVLLAVDLFAWIGMPMRRSTLPSGA